MQRAAGRVRGAAIGVLALSALAWPLVPAADAAPAAGINNIQHVVMIMQENRSFDSYFGTYPGANGIPAGVCMPDPIHQTCVAPFHDSRNENFGGGHGAASERGDINGGRMDGFIADLERQAGSRCGGPHGNGALCLPCNTPEGAAQTRCEDVMGYHDAREIPNYWSYAQNFVLQDKMFESARSWSAPEHNFLVSGWFAECPIGDSNAMDCESTLGFGTKNKTWTDITYLLAMAHVSWRYYIFEGPEPDCDSDEALICQPKRQSPKTLGIWNPLRDFTDVKADGQLENIQSLSNFYGAVSNQESCGLPNVSWVVPNNGVSEHPPSLVSKGQTYVTTLINSIMRSPCWNSTAIFVSWDDFGGFYDHVMPPNIDENGYGLRVPGLVISPYAKKGYIDHQQLSHDAYLKFIEDDFLGGGRLNPATDGRPDSRPDVREEAPGLGDLASEFDFSQQPRPPLLLPPHPEPGPASEPPGGPAQAPSVESGAASALTQTTATLNASVNPNGSTVTDCHFEYGPSMSYGASASCAQAPGGGSSPIAVSAQLEGLTANATYHFRILATNEGGTRAGADQTFATPPDPPTVLTGAASALAQSTATLNASVNPNGAPVSDCRFEYGTSAFYEASQPCSQAPGEGTSPVAVSAALEGLLARTTYHYRILAVNQGGTGYGEDQTFTTLPNPPTLTLLSPGAGPEAGGTTVTISGTDLSTATSVSFGSAAASSFTVLSDGAITAVSPPGTGRVDVTVTTAGGTSAINSADLFSYAKPPSVSKVTPGAGPAGGGTSVTISGASLTGATAVSFGAAETGAFTVNSPSSITLLSPAGTSGAVDVTVRTPGGTSAASPSDKFKYGPPTVSGLSPSAGSTAGGTSTTISGSGFALGTSATTFKFAASEASSVECASSTSCAVVTVPHKAGTVDVKATVNKLSSARNAPGDQFSFEGG